MNDGDKAKRIADLMKLRDEHAVWARRAEASRLVFNAELARLEADMGVPYGHGLDIDTGEVKKLQ